MSKETLSSMTRKSKYSFLSLYIAVMIMHHDGTIINKKQLENELLGVYDDEEFNFLFKAFCENNNLEKKVDLSQSFTALSIGGLLIPNDDGRYIIAITENEAQNIVSAFNGYDVITMVKLLEKLYPKTLYRGNTNKLIESMKDYLAYIKELEKNKPEEAKRIAVESLKRTGVITEEGPVLEKK